MYLKQLFMENSGSIKQIGITPDFHINGLPKPIILVGGNGSGKTNLLSTVTDALFEAASLHYENLLPKSGTNRSWFRVVGGASITTGESWGLSLLKFSEGDTNFHYVEKAGTVNPEALKSRFPAEYSKILSWPEVGAVKNFEISDESSKKIFENGVYVFFPSSRSEVPYWLNKDVVPEISVDVAPAFSNRLNKSIYNESSLEKFKQWLIGLIIDSRADIELRHKDAGSGWVITSDAAVSLRSAKVLELCDSILKSTLGNTSARFRWLGRKSSDKIVVADDTGILLPNLNALSAGQSILLGMFGTVLRYGDLSSPGSGLDEGSIQGICLIDEVDAHIHIDLQYKILPKLIRIFPAIQFILSSHSPLFVLGMEQEFGADGIQIIDMPSGRPVNAESYSEFGRALEIFTATTAFTENILEQAAISGKPVVYVEGETDAPYLKRAAALLGLEHLLENCDIEWIGGKDEGGQGFHTGKDALRHTLALFKANPSLIKRPMLLLHDNDSSTRPCNIGGVSVRIAPAIFANDTIRAGMESYLSKDCFDEKYFSIKELQKANGDTIVTRRLDKMALCSAMVESGTKVQFSAFEAVLKIIEHYLDNIQRSDQLRLDNKE